MKLLFISQYFPPETGAGATRADSLRRYLTDLGWEIDVLCELPNYPSGVIDQKYAGHWYHRTETKSGSITRTWVIPSKRENFLQQIGMFGSFMISSMLYGIMNPGRYDAVYATSPPFFGAISGYILSCLYKVPFYFEVRDLWPDAGVETGHIDKLNIVYKVSKKIERWLYKKSDLVIPVTRKSGELIRETCPSANTCVVYNGVDTEHFKPVPNALDIVDETFSKDKFRIGYAGTIGVIHDLDTVVHAAKLLEQNKDIEIIIIGDGSRSMHLQELLDNHQPANVRWLGIKDHSQIPTYLSTLDLALNPVYNTKVFGSIITVKFFEYLACEVPVLTMANGILKEVGDASGAAVTISPEDPKLLADTILALKNDPDKQARMKARARPFVLRYFDRRKWAAYLSDILKQNLQDGPSKPSDSVSTQDPISQSDYNW